MSEPSRPNTRITTNDDEDKKGPSCLLLLLLALLIFILWLIILFSGLLPSLMFRKERLLSNGNPAGRSAVDGGGARSPCPDNTLQVFKKDKALWVKLNKNMAIYKQAAAKNNIPWEALAALHYREHGLNPDNPANGQGPFQLYSLQQSNPSHPALSDFAAAADYAGGVLQGKVNNKLSTNPNEQLLREAFWAYNGRVNSPDVSPYVWNNFDQARYRMKWPSGHSLRGKTDYADGAFTVYYLLKYLGIYDRNGNLIGFKDCVSPVSSAGDSIASNGTYAAPISPDKLKAYLNAHGGTIPPHHGNPNDPAVDIGIATGTSIYAHAGGRIVSIMRSRAHYPVSVIPRTGRCGTGFVIAGDDGAQYVYCHMDTVSSNLRIGQHVDAGTQLGTSDNTGRSSGPHLHLGVKGMSASRLRRNVVDTVR